MGWNSSFVLAQKKSLQTLERAIIDVYAVTDEELDWETATASSLHPNMALGVLGSWAVAWTPSVKAATYPEMMEQLSKRGQAFTGMVYSHSSYYGFCYYTAGKFRRRLVRQNRRVVEETGEPVPEEHGLEWGDEEKAVFALAEQLTGLNPADINVWRDVRFKLARL